MREKIFILLLFLSLQARFVSMAQCPPKDSIQRMIIQQKVDGEHDAKKKMAILQDYKDKIIQCHFKKDSTYAWLLQKIGVEYKYRGNFPEAINYFLQAIEVNKSAINDSIANADIIDEYFWLSVYYDSLNNGPAKRKAIDSCIIFSERVKHPYNASSLRCLLNRVQYFYDIGEYKLCINDAGICEKGSLEYEKNASEASEIILGRWIAMNSLHTHINALFQLKNFTEAGKLLGSKLEDYKKNGPKSYLALTHSQLAELQIKKGDYQQALINFNMAFKTYREDQQYFSCKQTLNNIGEKIYYDHFKDYDQALDYFRKALAYKNNSALNVKEDSSEVLNIYGRIANVYVQKKLFDSAFFYFQLAFNQVKKGASISNILHSTENEFTRYKKIDYLSDLLTNYGDAYRKKYDTTKNGEDLKEAIRVYDIVDKFLARINISQFEQDSKLLWRHEARRLYEHAIEASYLAKDADKAFYFFERSRAVLLNIQLTQQNWLGNADIAKLDGVKRKILELSNAINNLAGESKEKGNLQDSLQKANEEQYTLMQLLKNHYPLYYQNLDTALFTIHEIRQSLLKDRQAILEMFSGDSTVYSLLITGKTVAINKIDKRDFESTVDLYTSYLSNYSLLNKDFPGFRKTSHHLYELILQNNPVPDGRIIISPEGYYFPFESLITDNISLTPLYFISGHAVSYTYSVRYLFNNFGSSTIVSAGNFLGVAPVSYSSGFHLPELSGSDLSLKNIGSFINGIHILVNKDASKSNFYKQFRDYKIAQLYTHASDSSDRNEPVIYFNDSALYMSELFPEGKPVTDLIVLSACQTGNGQLYQGEGVFSFNRGFASVGIPSSVSNLWSVDSKSTYALTELFYKYLAKGLPLDIALQKAKLEYMDDDSGENQMPYYWAAPVLVGKSDSIVLYKPFEWMYLIAGIGLVALCFLCWKIIRNNKKRTTPTPGKVETAS